MSIVLNPGQATLTLLERIYRGEEAFHLDRTARAGVDQSAEKIAQAVRGSAPIYGVNTGFGKLASVRIETAHIEQLQRNLILSHCAGTGAPLPAAITRLIMALKLLSLGRGASGVRWELIEQIETYVAAGILPVIPSQGSVGASGDLAPLAHMTAALIGEGEVAFRGATMQTADALSMAGISPLPLGPKEGLAMINGTQVSTALALAGLFDAWRLAVGSLTTCALSVDAAMGTAAPFREEIHLLRGHPGQIDAARRLRELLSGSGINASHIDGDERVQDPYCLRCQPQVAGACIDLMRRAGASLLIEANAVTDNPLVLPDGDIVSGGNFHAEPVAFAADEIAIAIAETGAISQRRISLLVDPALSYGLPAFLTPAPGLNSGLMIAEVTSAALMSENKALANPRSVDSTPTSANQEDHVSMACHGARRLEEMNNNLAGIIAVEAMAGAQGIDLRAPLQTSEKLSGVIKEIRSVCPPLTDDRILSGDIEALKTVALSTTRLADIGGVAPVMLELVP
ncbi:histidine ammonia-lyase [Parvularcula marina]|uniref:Histidine ammonia-lyase n=1 Tax=Parvularcula marina TaxID=2292771 RepID=A0A371RIA6_9PROT|nr:histidine ammonia-lyase [Parvularcula marina]RFB05168.1 histidine ammonia-lyase [Parvularcula marina]